MKPRLFCWVLCLALSVLGGCLREGLPPGVVATVNGQPITLRMIEARHDAEGTIAAVAQSPSIELLARQYGEILADLIAQELVMQELARLDLTVTEHEVDDMIAAIRNDYPEGEFDHVLFEDHINEKIWRDLMRYTLGVQRFRDQVLRPALALTTEEVERYYQEHAAEFLVPAQLVLVALTSPSEEALAAARDKVAAGGSLRDLPDVQVQHISLRPHQAPEVWKDELARLPAGKMTRIRQVNGMYLCLLLEKRNPPRRMHPVEAYPRIEQILIEDKLQNRFDEWLDAATAEAKISIASQLLPGKRPQPEKPRRQEDDPRNSEPIIDSASATIVGDAPGETDAPGGTDAQDGDAPASSDAPSPGAGGTSPSGAAGAVDPAPTPAPTPGPTSAVGAHGGQKPRAGARAAPQTPFTPGNTSQGKAAPPGSAN